MDKHELRGLDLYGYFDVGRSGIVLATDDETEQGQVSALVDSIVSPRQRCFVLTGTHGTRDGYLVDDEVFYWEDRLKELSNLTTVKVGTRTPDNTWRRYFRQHQALIILAWCHSARWRGLRDYLG